MSYINSLPEDFETVTTKKPYINLSKLAEGEYKFRIVQRPIAGWLDWKDRKPLRFRPKDKPKASIDPTRPVRPFWAMYVWDYAAEGLYIMEITQNSIRCTLEDLAKNEDWGDLTSFDFKIKKTGNGIETNYSVIPVPHKPLLPAIKESLAANPVRLEALYDGLDPWTDAALPEVPFVEPVLSEGQCAQIDALLNKINDPSYLKQLEAHLKVACIYNINPHTDFERAIRSMEKRLESVNSKGEKANVSAAKSVA